jgi:hypothetical protein
MKRSLRPIVALMPAILMALAQGCSDTPAVDTSQIEVPVTGVVMVKGKPASGGQISFNPSNRDRKVSAFTAPIGQDGSYSIKTYTGENEVRFLGDVDKANPMVGMIKKYCNVTSGGHQQDFDLMGESENASGKSKIFSEAAAKGGRGGRRPGGK